ncbi:quinohemoprotein amine dehydrogenase subunit alpha [Pseudomaricurvus alkylphenolicus]|uniref:quinohemoprotein amine dehydrogenase subunit alpha n=1 Tax=Pseudomaricurvus alkylphenolicus TaxID=1306991 RepID=UPI001980B5B3
MVKSLNSVVRRLVAPVGLWTATMLAPLYATAEINAGEELLRNRCMGCHVPEQNEPLQLSRISHQRKTPEGWLMSIARMQMVHGAQITSDERRTLVKFLADTQGLTPQESAPYRYILERRLNHIEDKQPQLAEMCARCHSEARVGLQRRDAGEWEHLVNFHLGQWPSIEYSAMGRDRDWLGLALNEVVPFLDKNYGLQKDHWQQWLDSEKASPIGEWRLVGSMPGRGDFHGVMKVIADGEDRYRLNLTGKFADGKSLRGKGQALVYSGYEWRADITLGKEKFQQVLAMNPQGDRFEGRMFLKQQETLGVNLTASRADKPSLLAVSPAFIEAGKSQQISVRGTQLSGDVSLGPGIEVLKVLKRGKNEIRLKVRARKGLETQALDVRVGEQNLAGGLRVYDRIDSLQVSPAYAVARVGDGGGSQEKVKAAFEARAYGAGEDGVNGTADDIYIGTMPANWSLAPFDQQAIEDRDLDFVGKIDRRTGVFTPAAAGPNSKRKYGTNNAGRMSVIASVGQGDNKQEAKAELIVTVQRWNNPPIR